MNLRKLLAAAATLTTAVGLAPLVSCSAGSGGNALTLYNGQHEQTTRAMVDAFTRQTGIKVNVRSGDEAELSQQIVTEGSASPADVFYAENTPAMENLDEKHLLAPLDATTLAQTPSTDAAATRDWVAVSARVSGIVYNTKRLTPSQLPTSVLDLAQPGWKGKVGLAPAETDFGPVIAGISVNGGEAAAVAWLRAVKSNAGDKVYPSNEALLTAINQGVVSVGVMNSYYWYRAKQEQGSIDSAFAFFAPHDPGYVVDLSTIGVLASSTRKADAQRLVAFLAGPQGEQILAHSASFEYPLATGVAADPRLAPFSSLAPTTVDLNLLGDGHLAKTMLQQAGFA